MAGASTVNWQLSGILGTPIEKFYACRWPPLTWIFLFTRDLPLSLSSLYNSGISTVSMALSRSRDRSSSVSSPATAATTPEAISADDDIWASDHENDSTASNQAQAQSENLLSDLPTVKRQHMTDGYREGLSVGKAKVMQKGFDDGYPLGVMIALRAGKILGCMEGVLAAKDIPNEQKTAVRKLYEQAKSELAINSLLKDMNDQMIMESDTIPAAVANTVKKWEIVTCGTAVVSKGRADCSS